MKPAPFEYHRVYTSAEAVETLSELGEDAKILAGGLSLTPMMNFRLARPSALIDVNPVHELEYISRDADELVIGALTKHRSVEVAGSCANFDGFEFFPRAVRWIGHFPIRARGTVGGSIAHSDPTAEWCLLAALSDADVVVKGPSGMRRVPYNQWFQGFLMNSAAPDELVIETRFKRPRQYGALTQYARRKGDFAIVAAGVAFDIKQGALCDVSIVLGGVSSEPLRLTNIEAGAEGLNPTENTFDQIAAAAAQECEPPSDMHGGPDYRRHVVRTMVVRAFAEAVQFGGAQ